MTLIARLLAFFLLACVASPGFLTVPLHAQEQPSETAPKIDKRKLLVQPRNADGTIDMPSFWSDPVLWVIEQQRSFYGAMSQSLRQMKAQSSLLPAYTLMLLSFGYGIFHAAGPGHGKAVISAWLLATENELRRGILIAFMSALIQALTAIVVISALLLLVTAVGSTARDVAGFLESASYGLIALMGAYLIWSAFRPHGHAHAPEPAHVHAHDHHHGHDHHDHDHHHHDHGPDCGCGHAHVPQASEVKGDWSLTKALSLSFAVGIRPCTGSLLVLISAYALGIYWAGITSTLVMALGTAITVSVIAAIAVYSKKLALRLARKDSAWLEHAAFGLRVIGGLVILGLGGLLFWGSLYSTNVMM
jgi:nickel/cobalt exporter